MDKPETLITAGVRDMLDGVQRSRSVLERAAKRHAKYLARGALGRDLTAEEKAETDALALRIVAERDPIAISLDSPAADMRRLAGLTQEELAERLDITQSAIGQGERAGMRSQLVRLIEVADACGLVLTLTVRRTAAVASAEAWERAAKGGA